MKVRLLSIVILVAVLFAGVSAPKEVEASSCTPVYHVVKVGQNLTQIARYYGVSVQAIVSANNLWNPNLIYVGQHLRIPVPCQQPPPPSTACTKIHVVQRGEYLKIIAARYGTTVTAIVNLNGIKNPNLIYPGQRLKIPVKCQPTPPKATPTPKPGTTGAWTGQYWANRFFSGDPKFTTRHNRVNFTWGTKGPGGGIAGTNFSARFKRTRYLDGGLYRFYVQVDDGVRVWVDGVLIIDQWHDTPSTLYTADRQLSSGNHSFQVDYYQNQGTAQVIFWPELVDGKAPWKAEYFNNKNLNGDPKAVRYYNAIDFDWGKNAPVSGLTADHFSARFTGEFYFVGGKYQFTATVDDGVRLYLDDTLIMDQWHVTSVRTYNVNVDVSEGNHRLKVEYFENEGVAVCKVRWTQR